MDQAKLGTTLRILVPLAIFFVCGVAGFSVNNALSPVLKTVEIMAVVCSFGYLIYRIDPKPEARKYLISLRDCYILSIVFACTITCAFIVTGHCLPIKGFQVSGLVFFLISMSRLVSRLNQGFIQSLLKALSVFGTMIGSEFVFKTKVDPFLIAGLGTMIPIFALIDAKTSKAGRPGRISQEDIPVLKGIAKF